MINQIKLIWLKPSSWHQLTRFVIDDDLEINGFKIKRGFVVDGASIPFGFRSAFNPMGKVFPAAIVHDYMCKYDFDRKEADDLFYENMLECGVNRGRAYIQYLAVRAYAVVTRK